MSENLRESQEPPGARIRRNLVNIGFFLVKVLLLVFEGPPAIRFFMPVIVGWIIAQIANPLVQFLEKRLHIVRRHSSMAIMAGSIFLIVLACYGAARWMVREFAALIKRLPQYYQAMMEGFGRIGENLEKFAGRLSPETQQNIESVMGSLSESLSRFAGSLGGGTVEAAGNAARNIPSLLISFIFVLLFAYFFIAERERIQKIGRILVSEEDRKHLRMIWSNLKSAVGGYFRAQFKIMGVVFILMLAGLLILRVDYAVLLALAISLLDFLPMLGTGTVLLPWALYCALSGGLPRAAGLLILYGVTQFTRQLIQPKMVGDSVGIDTLTTLFLIFIGYRIYGIIGMIIAIPVGLILIQLYEAGAFENVIRNFKELLETVSEWRRDRSS